MKRIESFCLFAVLEVVLKATVTLADQSDKIKFNVTVRRSCNYEGARVFAPPGAVKIFKNFSKGGISGVNKTYSLQCSSPEKETFMAETRKCVKNNVLVERNHCSQLYLTSFKCDDLQVRRPFRSVDIMTIDSRVRFISVKVKNCRPSKSRMSKYLDCWGFWKNLTSSVFYKKSDKFKEWILIKSLNEKETDENKRSFIRELQGRLIKVELECKNVNGSHDVHNVCVLLKAIGIRTCQFQAVSPTLDTVTTAKVQSIPNKQLDARDIDKSSTVRSLSKILTTGMIYPTISSSSEKEGRIANNLLTKVVIGVATGACASLIVICWLVFRKQKSRKENSDAVSAPLSPIPSNSLAIPGPPSNLRQNISEEYECSATQSDENKGLGNSGQSLSKPGFCPMCHSNSIFSGPNRSLETNYENVTENVQKHFLAPNSPKTAPHESTYQALKLPPNSSNSEYQPLMKFRSEP